MYNSKNNLKPEYFVKLDASVRYNNCISPASKILYAEITALSNAHGFCYAKNRHFQDLFDVSKQTINNWLKELEINNYIVRHIYRKPGSKEILNRYITLFDKPVQINLNRPIQDILKDNIITNNTKSKTKFNKQKIIESTERGKNDMKNRSLK